jgi:spore maturation protein CgeB
MKILLVGNFQEWSLENFYRRAFQNLGIKVEVFDPRARRLFVDGSSLPSRVFNRLATPANDFLVQREVRQHFRKQGNEYSLVIVFKGRELSRQILDECRSHSKQATWANLNPDDPLDRSNAGGANRNVVEGIPAYDAYFVWSRNLVEKVNEAGAKAVFYLPFGFDEIMHAPSLRSRFATRDSVVFVGSWDRDREEWLSRVDATKLQIFGWAWDRASSQQLRPAINNKMIFGHDLALVTGEAAACINILRRQNLGSHNMRTFEVPAMNGLLLTMRSAEQQGFFPEGEASLMFGSPDELNDLIGKIRSSPDWSATIRKRGHDSVKNHTYTDRAKQLLQYLDV